MAKGKDMNKKQQDRAKSSMVVDKTFGMKNKNKSKKVQKYIANVKNAADNRFTDRKEEKAKKEAMSRKEAKKAHEAEMAALFNAVPEKPKKKDKFAQDEAAPAEESVDDTAAFLEQMGISVPQADGRRKQARARRDAEANAKEEERLRKLAERDGKSVEERLEIIRKGLQLDVAVNKDTFLQWKKDRNERRAKEEEAKLDKAKKNTSKNGKGKSMLTGRQLFEFHQQLFVDDAEAGGADNYKKEFEDAEDAWKITEGGAAAEGEGAAAEGAPAEAPASEPAPPSNSTAPAPESTLDGVDESVFLAENLDDLDDLPSDDDE